MGFALLVLVSGIGRALPLSATLWVSPAAPIVGDTVTVALAVTNLGGANVTGITPTIQLNTGAGVVTLVSGPVPAGPVTLAPGFAATFVWTWSASGIGAVSWTLTAAGTDSGTGLPTGESVSTAKLVSTVPACSVAWGTISTILGSGTKGISNNGTPAISASTWWPHTIAFDPAGNIFVAEHGNHRISKINLSTGALATVAGTGIAGYNGDNISATLAQLNGPMGLAVDAVGDLYVAENFGDRIRKVSASTGMITPVAGTGISGYNGDGISATVAQISNPHNISLDLAGNLLIADGSGRRIRKVTVSTGLISTIVGDGISGSSGDGGVAASARLNWPVDVRVDPVGNIYIADYFGCRVRKISAATGLISTFAGTGVCGFGGDGGPATSGQLNGPFSVAYDGGGEVYIADAVTDRVRRVAASNGYISTVAGTAVQGFNGDGIPASTAQLYTPTYVIVGPGCRLYLCDAENHRLRVVDLNPAMLTATMWFSPVSPVVGQWMVMSMTITNTGGATAAGVMPALQWNLGAGLFAPKGGPVPSGPVTLASGASATFTWTWSVSGAGPVSWTLTAAGTDANSGSPVAISLTGALTARAAAALRVSAAVDPPAGPMGSVFTISLTVTNAGGVDATGVTPLLGNFSGGGLSIPVSGPVPPGPVTLAPGAAATFAWTRSVVGSGWIGFSLTALGTDSVLLRPVLGAATVFFGAALPAYLDAHVSAPAVVIAGQSFTVSLTLTNTGSNPATGVLPGPLPTVSPLFAGWVAGPSPTGPLVLTAGAAATFSWTFSATGLGVVSLSVTASGTDGVTAAVLSAPAVTSLVIVLPGSPLSSRLRTAPTAVRAGESFQVEFTVSNSGAQPVANLLPVLTAAVPGVVEVLAGPVPVAGATLLPGGTIVFVWLVRVRRPGLVDLAATAGGDIAGYGVSTGSTTQIRISRKHSESIVTFPNPVPGQSFTVSLGLDADADEVEIDLFDMGLQRVYRGRWTAVAEFDGDLTVERLKSLPGGLYLLRARARLAGGRTQTFPAVKVVLE